MKDKVKIKKTAIVALVLLAAVYIIPGIFISGEKFCREEGVYDAHTIKVNMSEDIGEEFITYELTAEDRAQLEDWIEGMRLMKVFSKDSFDVDNLRVLEIVCYNESGDLSGIITVFGNSYIKTHGFMKMYKIL